MIGFFNQNYARESLHNHFDVKSLKGFGIEDFRARNYSSWSCFTLSYQKHNTNNYLTFRTISRIAEDDYVWMDRFTVRNLELYHGTSINSVTLIRHY